MTKRDDTNSFLWLKYKINLGGTPDWYLQIANAVTEDDTEKLVAGITCYIKTFNYMHIFELIQILRERGFPVDGNEVLYYEGKLIWAGLSMKFIEMLIKLKLQVEYMPAFPEMILLPFESPLTSEKTEWSYYSLVMKKEKV